ncbi:hypothetical protein, conserved [Leishmania donovani]|uniref:Uncharacterized protein n=1 Tax=Leishmania donovani TaxID=5661 RepID=E9BRR7_LEIDO|nr:hypothetical protein, conserved [Leishmania donovani]TPP44323.1 hypothetical protein CGC21_5780 [Leishmania donovani]CBZ37946.1 hypothetical protein, conserved [Leishmania donovani]
MSATIKAARACASTVLFRSLRLHAFQGALPHVLVVVDRVPCVLQKVVAEGYLEVLRAYGRQGAAYVTSNCDSVLRAPTEPFPGTADDRESLQSHNGELFIPLEPGAETPSGSAGFTPRVSPPSFAADESAPLSYSLMPFCSDNFLSHVKRLQRFFRHCGDGQLQQQCHQHETEAAAGDASITPPPPTALPSVWTSEYFKEEFEALCPLLGPLLSSKGEAVKGDATDEQPRWQVLFHGPPRELLGCVMVQENAFQNEMRRYRLRLSLFDLGIRVAEHCHLGIMSQRADRLAGEGHFKEALEDDQVYSYARSCAFRPEHAQCLAKAIADSIDLYSWRRSGCAGGAAARAAQVYPASITAALQSAELWSIFNTGALNVCASSTAADDTATDVEAVLREPIEGPGMPLLIVCRDTAKVLTYGGGMEDCLTNTGYYAAAYAPERNDVARHRERFRTAYSESSGGDGESERDEEDATANPPVHGRLKKKEYLAVLRAKGQKPNKPQHDNADDEDGAVSRSVPAGSCISNSIGGTFPIGEVISESFDLSQLSGTCDVFAYPDVFKKVTMSRPSPFTMTVEKGVVTYISDGAPKEFFDLFSLVRQVEGECYVRELGIGLNPYVGPAHVVSDVTTFERQWGIHLSLGQRHPLFVKQRERRNADGSVATGVHVDGPVLKRKAGKYHIDVFVDAAQLRMGDMFAVDFTKGIAVP